MAGAIATTQVQITWHRMVTIEAEEKKQGDIPSLDLHGMECTNG